MDLCVLYLLLYWGVWSSIVDCNMDRLGKAKNQNQRCNICVFIKPHDEATAFHSKALIEFPQLVELTQKLCVLEDFSFTQPIGWLHGVVNPV